MKFKFATVITCIDGRVQKPVMEFAIKKFGADYIDMITEPGPARAISENKALDVIESLKSKVLLSVRKHDSRDIIIAGHHDCAVNPVGKEDHLIQIRDAVSKMEGWGLGLVIYGAWVDENWQVVLL